MKEVLRFLLTLIVLFGSWCLWLFVWERLVGHGLAFAWIALAGYFLCGWLANRAEITFWPRREPSE